MTDRHIYRAWDHLDNGVRLACRKISTKTLHYLSENADATSWFRELLTIEVQKRTRPWIVTAKGRTTFYFESAEEAEADLACRPTAYAATARVRRNPHFRSRLPKRP